ncbi:MAG: putative lipopolysaccharide heptosyltransferase III [Magnetococcales bacterium]|nr:putative lipopolysaccharide heptosyltransferase III [Magnetococcales bacterium]
MVPPRRILLIKLKHIGDALLATPLARVLRENFPEATVSFLVIGAAAEVLEGNPWIHQVWRFERGSGVKRLLALFWWLWRSRFDVVIDLSGGGDRGAICTWMTGAGVRLGHLLTRVPWQRNLTNRLAYHPMQPEPGHDQHAILRDLALAAPLGLRHDGLHVTLPVLPAAREAIQALLLREGDDGSRPLCLIHATSRWMFKCLPPETMAHVADAMALEYGAFVVMTGADCAVEKKYLTRIIDNMKTKPLILAGHFDLKGMAALLDSCDFYIGVDTAPSHMAAALDLPTVVVFGPTKPHLWGPWPNGVQAQPYTRGGGAQQAGNHWVCRLDWPCIPCDRDGCAGSKVSRCLTELSVAFIMEIIARHWLRALQRFATRSGGQSERRLSKPTIKKNGTADHSRDEAG